MKKYLQKGFEAVSPIIDKAVNEVTDNITLFKDVVDGLPIFSSLQTSKKYPSEDFDEKHYFVIPYEISEYKFVLHTMRCLPDGIPEINDLPKRRVFHFGNDQAEHALRHYMLDSARNLVHEQHKDNPSTLESLANDIDALESKLTYGMLLVGGIAAVFNPIVGAGIAAKALLPGAAGIINKYGLRPTGEKISQLQLEKDIKQAEQSITQQFEESDTLWVVNPILQELDFALRTNESQHDPLTDPNLADGSIPELSHERWRELTEIAICHVYKEIYKDETQHKSASLGPEDIRWLKVMFDTVKIK